MEAEVLMNPKSNLKKKIQFTRDLLMVLLAFFFMVVAFVYALDKTNSAGDNYRNIRYGLFAFALIVSATALIIAVYTKSTQTRKSLIKHNHTGKKKK